MLFKDINLIEPIQKALVKSGYMKATPIQEKSIPQILDGLDLFGIAQTGTGKTAAFTLPILQLMYNQNKVSKSPRTLILAPTRELAAQIGDSIKEYGSFTRFRQTVIFGGVSQGPQQKAIERGCDIIIATPGRLLDLMQQGIINLSTIEFFILDEADRMLDMGFINDIKKIVKKLPKKRQSLFFSATMSKVISELAKTFLINPRKVEVTPEATTIEKIKQGVYFVDTPNKDKLLLKIIKSEKIPSALVFTRTKHKANKVAKFLSQNGIKSEAIHGNKSQPQRVNTLKDFKSGKLQVLVATEIVARGIDIDKISHVINYEIPNEPESYVHRIGRTARAGNEGTAYSFCAADERYYLRDIEKLIKQEIKVIEHDMHSDFAQEARGDAAKPKPKAQFHKKKTSDNKSGSNSGNGKNNYGKKKFGNKNKSSSSESQNKNNSNSGNSRFKPKGDNKFNSNSNSQKSNFKSKNKSSSNGSRNFNKSKNFLRK